MPIPAQQGQRSGKVSITRLQSKNVADYPLAILVKNDGTHEVYVRPGLTSRYLEAAARTLMVVARSLDPRGVEDHDES